MMKRICLFLFLLLFAGQYGFGQNPLGGKKSDPKEMALIMLDSELKEVSNVTVEQRRKLVDIMLAIDKEHPFLTSMTITSPKQYAEKMKAIDALKLSLFPKVLNGEQMKEYVAYRKKQEISRENNKDKKKNKDKKRKKKS